MRMTMVMALRIARRCFPLDATETIDTDLDGTGNNADTMTMVTALQIAQMPSR